MWFLRPLDVERLFPQLAIVFVASALSLLGCGAPLEGATPVPRMSDLVAHRATPLAAVPEGGASLLDNGGFEIDRDGDSLPDGWTTNNWGDSEQVQGFDRESKREGQQSIAIEKTNASGAATYTQIKSILPSTEYVMALSAKGDAGLVIVGFFDADGERDPTQNVQVEVPPGEEWRRWAFKFTTPPDVAQARVWLGTLAPGEVWYDDVALFGDSPAEPTPTAEVPTPTSGAVVDGATLLSEMPEVGDSLLEVGGFESDEDEDGVPDGWTTNNWGGSEQIQSLDGKSRVEGQRSVVIEKTNASGTASYTQKIGVQPDAIYVLALSAKGAPSSVIVGFFDADGQRDKDRDIKVSIPAGENWHRWALELRTPLDAAQARLWLAVSVPGQVWFDEAGFFPRRKQINLEP